jgi:cell envelope opacity-associated protein A
MWKDKFQMFELTKIMRQQDCIPFAELLNRLREGNHTTQDIELLNTRVINSTDSNYPFSAQHLFKTNLKVDDYNNQMYQTCPNEKYIVQSIDSVMGAVSDDMADRVLQMIPNDSRQTLQLQSRLPLAVGCRYEISNNVDIADGLANGAGGVVQRIQLSNNTLQASGIVWMLFDDVKVGAKARSENKPYFNSTVNSTWTPVFPIARQFQVGRSQSNQVIRKQFPLRPSAAKTIHRCQGDTLAQVVVDFSTKRKEAHTHYVGLSRVKTLDGLFILNLCEDKIHVSNNVKLEMSKLRTERAMSISLHLPYLHNETHYQFSFLNVRSLHKKIDCVRKDHSLTGCNAMMFCETRTSQHDPPSMYDVTDFYSVFYSGYNTGAHCSHYGIALYSQNLSLVRSSVQPLSLDHSISRNTMECTLMRAGMFDITLHIFCIYSTDDLIQTCKISMNPYHICSLTWMNFKPSIQTPNIILSLLVISIWMCLTTLPQQFCVTYYHHSGNLFVILHTTLDLS